MTRGIGTLAGLALLAGLLTGCGDDGMSGGEPDPTSEATTLASAAPDPVVELTVHSTGAGPRRLLSVPLVEGARERVQISTEQDYLGVTSRTRTPETLTVTEVYDDGSARVELHSGPRVTDGAKGKETWHRWARVTPEGRVLDGGALDGDASTDPVDVDWDLQRELTPVPEEPVGVGAEWSVEYATEVGGMEFRIAERYRVSSIKGDTVTLAQIVGEVSGSTEESKEQGAEDGISFEIQGQSWGTGTVTLVVGQLLSEETLDSDLEMSTESRLDARFTVDGTPEHEVEQSEADAHFEVTRR